MSVVKHLSLTIIATATTTTRQEHDLEDTAATTLPNTNEGGKTDFCWIYLLQVHWQDMTLATIIPLTRTDVSRSEFSADRKPGST